MTGYGFFFQDSGISSFIDSIFYYSKFNKYLVWISECFAEHSSYKILRYSEGGLQNVMEGNATFPSFPGSPNV